MKSVLIILCNCFLLVILSSCKTSEHEPMQNDDNMAQSDDKLIPVDTENILPDAETEISIFPDDDFIFEKYFPDPGFRGCVRNAFGINETVDSWEKLKSMTGFQCWSQYRDETGEVAKVKSIEGIQYFVNLEKLKFDGTDYLESIAPMQELKKLKIFWMNGTNISDISALASLTSLEEYHLSSNKINDVTPLSHANNADFIYLDGNLITDIMPLFEIKPIDNEIIFITLSHNCLDKNKIEKAINNDPKASRIDFTSLSDIEPQRSPEECAQLLDLDVTPDND